MMYDGYDGEDEDTRRARRDEQYPPTGNVNPNDGKWHPPGWDTGGIGPADSGYGPGGVENPAYTATTTPPTTGAVKGATFDEGGRMFDPALPPPPRTGGGNPTPSFQAPQAAPAAAAAPTTKTPGITDEVTKILMSRLNDLKNPGDVSSDPIYQQAVRSYQIGQLRSADTQRKALAERTAATGGTTRSGGFNVGVRGIQERAGENSAQYRSGLALDRLSAREQQLNEAIKMARAVGQDDIANQLEMQRLALQGELGRGDLALRGELGRGNLGLGQDQLGFSYADMIQRMNRDATLAILNGGG